VLGEHIHIADPNVGIIRHLKNILDKQNLLNDTEINNPLVEMVNSGGEVNVENAKNMLQKHCLI
jgi:hypothetical protein